MNMQRKGIVLVISAASGTGKTTLVKRLLAEFPRFGYSISCTTRPPRAGEVDGRDYHFLSREEFLRRRDAGYFAEWAEVYGNYYGSPLQPTLDMLARGQDVLFEIDVQGAAQLRLNIPQAQCIFILPPSLPVLEQRLRGRGTDDEEVIRRRLDSAAREIAEAHWFSTWIVNDDLDTAYAELRAAYLAATLAPTLRPGLLRTILAPAG
ncbi:MAG: guanylate kinase [Desulfovibrionaceae bacterium]|nr:guanylate kinase [Desulfovibrionaceae bacterium]